jgi:hypothetical protein
MAERKPAKKPKEAAAAKEAPTPAHAPTPAQERQQKQREEKAAEFERQVAEGTLVIRQMTPAERKANPPRERPQKKQR